MEHEFLTSSSSVVQGLGAADMKARSPQLFFDIVRYSTVHHSAVQWRNNNFRTPLLLGFRYCNQVFRLKIEDKGKNFIPSHTTKALHWSNKKRILYRMVLRSLCDASFTHLLKNSLQWPSLIRVS